MTQKKKSGTAVSIFLEMFGFHQSFAVWRTMDDDEEHRRYGDSTILEPIIEQQDDQLIDWLIEEYRIISNIVIDDKIFNE